MPRELPETEKLVELAGRFPSDRQLSEHLGVARTTLREHIARIGAREGMAAAREPDEPADTAEIPVLICDYTDHQRHHIYPLGDVHIGARTHNADTWEKWLEYVYTKKSASLMGTGDFLNTAIMGSKSDVYDEEMSVGEAKRILIRQLTPLAKAGRIDCLMPGNHENRIKRTVGDCPIRDVCDALEIQYIEASAQVVYELADAEYEVYLRHGSGSGQSLTALSKSQLIADADIYITGHTHRQAMTTDDHFVRRGEQMVRRKRYFVSSGSFLGYETYSAERGYPPARLGAPRIFLDGTRWDVHISL